MHSQDKGQVFLDASFRAKGEKACFGFAIWFDGFWVHEGSIDGSKVPYSKEAVARALKKVSLLGFLKVNLFSDALEVI